MNIKRLYLLGLILIACRAFAAIEYCPDTETIRVTDYPADYPCTPRLLAWVDQTFGWGRVTLDEKTGIVTVAANLTIGWNDGSKTFFQIADRECPDETLVVQGELRVYPYCLIDENYDSAKGPPPHSSVFARAGIINRLRLGLPDNPSVRGALVLEKHARGIQRLVIGGFSGYGTQNMGGQLLVYNSSISAGTDSLIEEAYMGVIDRLVLINSTIRGVKSVFGKALGRGTYENTLFENCGVAATGTYLNEVRGCSFINCGTGVNVARDCAIYDCKFEGNRLNWHLSYQGRLVAVDCEIDSWEKGAYSTHPSATFVSKRHLRVKLLDHNRRPVAGGMIEIIPLSETEIAASEFDNFHSVTDQNGDTPGPGQVGSLLVTERMIGAHPEKDQPPVHTLYTYLIKARVAETEIEKRLDVPFAAWEEFELVMQSQD